MQPNIRAQKILPGLILAIMLTACSTSPTGDPQLHLLSSQEVNQLGRSAYEEMKKNTPISKNQRVNNYVNCVAQNVLKVVPSDYSWEITVFDDKAINAFALPGGKIGVYTGILGVVQNQNQLAAVIGHEVAHVTAQHANARISAAYATNTGLQLLQVLSGATTPEKKQLIGLLGLGAQYGVLQPYGRGQESEADIIGLKYMAKAGFDPRESIELWKNMAAKSGAQPPEFLSTHPSNQSRIQDLNKHMTEAVSLYGQAVKQGKHPNCQQP